MVQNFGGLGGTHPGWRKLLPQGMGDTQEPRLGLGSARENPKPSPGVWTKVRWLCAMEQGERAEMSHQLEGTCGSVPARAAERHYR